MWIGLAVTISIIGSNGLPYGEIDYVFVLGTSACFI